MKKVTLSALALALILGSCTSYDTGELTGVQGRKKFYEPEPYEMAFIPAGSYTQGPSDQDPLRAMNSMSKTVTVEAFWMDQTEIPNNKYRQFTYWVRDSILRNKLGEEGVEGYEFFGTEWEYAARGGLDLSMYPWGGPYTRNYQGCFLANFKPLRGNYIDDGAVYTITVSYTHLRAH